MRCDWKPWQGYKPSCGDIAPVATLINMTMFPLMSYHLCYINTWMMFDMFDTAQSQDFSLLESKKQMKLKNTPKSSEFYSFSLLFSHSVQSSLKITVSHFAPVCLTVFLPFCLLIFPTALSTKCDSVSTHHLAWCLSPDLPHLNALLYFPSKEQRDPCLNAGNYKKWSVTAITT